MKFTKMHGCGNDYIFVNCFHEVVKNPEKVSRLLSDRHFGIGGDGLILIGDSNVADFRMNMYNSDGSVGEMCGNAIRCVGKYVYENKMTNKTVITVETLAGIRTLFLTVNQNHVVEVMVDLGKPILIPKEIPVVSEKDQVINETIEILDRSFQITCVSMGNPHAVVFVDNVGNFPVAKYGLPMEYNLKFPNRTNVEFVQIIDRNNIKMRVWERGSGETLACGTGTAACVVAGVMNGWLDDYVIVNCLGGKLKIRYDKEEQVVYMSGTAKLVYHGEVDLGNLS